MDGRNEYNMYIVIERIWEVMMSGLFLVIIILGLGAVASLIANLYKGNRYRLNMIIWAIIIVIFLLLWYFRN